MGWYFKNVEKKIFLHALSGNNSVNLMNYRRMLVEKCIPYCSSLTKLWIPSFLEATLSEIPTITAGKPIMHFKKWKTKMKKEAFLSNINGVIN